MPVVDVSPNYREPAVGPPVEEPEPHESHEWRAGTVTLDQHAQRLDKVLVGLAPEFSRSHLQQLLERGHVQVDGVLSLTSSRRLRAGQRVQIELVPTDESRAFCAQPMALDVVFEDEHLLILNKPAGLVVHPAPGNWAGTLLNGLLARYDGAFALPRAGIVHRLDKDTSGVMMVGKTLPAVTALTRDIAARAVHRRYLALAHGTPEQPAFSVEAPIGRDPANRVRMAVVQGGKAARTDVVLLGSTSTPSGEVSALACTLHSGRTHQIRVHLAHRALPLVADALYGGRPLLGLVRQALHATELRVQHPISRDPLVFACCPPNDFERAWRQVCTAKPE